MIDLVQMKGLYWDDASRGTKVEEREIPDELVQEAVSLHQQLVETAAEANDELM